MEKEVEGYYKNRAKEFVNMLYDKNFIVADLSRESLDALEVFVGEMIQMLCDSAVKCALLNKKYKDGEIFQPSKDFKFMGHNVEELTEMVIFAKEKGFYEKKERE